MSKRPRATVTAQAPNDPLSGSSYRSERVLGEGAMGMALLARHRTLGHRCVVKIMRPHMLEDPRGLERMRLEAQAIAHLNHPNIVRVLDFDQTPAGRLYYVMEYLEGEPLNQEAYNRVALPWAEACAIACQVLCGLAEVHKNGIVHRDIKPSNLFYTVADAQAGQPRMIKIIDFGIAKVVDEEASKAKPIASPTQTGAFLGSPKYMAPEQFGGKVTPACDLYATALTLYQLLCGRGPFDVAVEYGQMAMMQMCTPPDPPSDYATTDFPDRLEAAVLKALSKAPEDRFASADAFRNELVAILQGSADHSLHAGAPQSWKPDEQVSPDAATTPLGAVGTKK